MIAVLTRLLAAVFGPEDPWRVVRFAIVGVGSTLIYAVLAYLFTVRLQLPAVVGSVLAYCCGAVFSYTTHRRVTFRSDRPVVEEVSRFAGISFAGWIVAIISPLILTNAWGLPPIVAIVFASIAVPLLSFLGMERFVFRARPVRRPVDETAVSSMSDGAVRHDGQGGEDGR